MTLEQNPLTHGFDSQGFITLSHRDPWKPVLHRHWKVQLTGEESHCPLLRHGLLAQKLTGSAQLVPVNPQGHLQINLLAPVVIQVPPFWQELIVHASSI